jgi:methylthioribose-1-phosphate isomerase
VKGFYPAFDLTPPELISAVITTAGIEIRVKSEEGGR